MKKFGVGMMLLGMALISFGGGYFLASNHGKYFGIKQQAAVGIENNSKIPPQVFDDNTKIVFEKEYTRCQHVIISDFEQKDELRGKSLAEIKAIFTGANGFEVSMQDDTLIIHQQVADWCPEDKGKCRLKEYKGRVAIYQGPDAENDILLRVTSIAMASLPPEVQESIKNQKFEFKTEQLLNDALENLDEY